MNLKPVLILAILYFYINAHGFDNYPVGARSASMANASVVNVDVWSAQNNQAAMAFYNKFSLGLHQENKFLIPENAYRASLLTIPVKFGTFGLSYTLFGDKVYNDKKIGVGFAKKLMERMAIGVQTDLVNTYILQYGSESLLSAEIGILAEPIDHFFVGAHIFNPFRIGYKDLSQYYFPSVIKMGAGYNHENKIMLNVEAEKQLDEKPIYKAGVDYNALYGLYIRMGISSFETQYSFGLGYIYKKMYADIGFMSDRDLGFTPHFSLCYEFR